MGRAQGASGESGTDCGCQIWGVLNVTPDSFSDGGRFLALDSALGHARTMLAQGADVIDVGGASSRPAGGTYGEGAAPISDERERDRVLPVIELLNHELGARISVDTTSPRVADAALRAGARVVNDVSGAARDELLRVVASHGADYVLMHTRGRGEVRPPNTDYVDVVAEVRGELLRAVERAEQAGVARARIWLDPGIGFAKTPRQSLRLLAATAAFCELGMRVLVGASRKGFIAECAPRPDGGRPAPDEREPGTAAAVAAAVLGGAQAVRVHDVAATRQALLVANAIRESGGSLDYARGAAP